MIYAKTELGIAAIKDRSVPLTPRQRSAFIMFDGKRSASDILKLTTGVGVTQSDVEHLVAMGLLAPSSPYGLASVSTTKPQVVEAPTGSDASVSSLKADERPALSAQAHYSMAYPIATRLTAALGLRGFRLNLAVEAAGDLDKLKELAPKIRDAVGAEKFQELDDALNF